MYFILYSLSYTNREKAGEYPSPCSVLFICLTNLMYEPEMNKYVIATGFALCSLFLDPPPPSAMSNNVVT